MRDKVIFFRVSDKAKVLLGEEINERKAVLFRVSAKAMKCFVKMISLFVCCIVELDLADLDHPGV